MPAQRLLPGAPRLACSLPPSVYLFCVPPPLSEPPPPQPPPRPALRLHPTSLIIASFSERQIVQPGDAPEDLRPLTNGLLIFYHKGRGRGGAESITHPSSSSLPRDSFSWLTAPGEDGVKRGRGAALPKGRGGGAATGKLAVYLRPDHLT